MGLFSRIFNSSGGDSEPTVRVRESRNDTSKVVGDKYTPTGGGKHTHDSYKLDKASGSYKEYRGGENSRDRSYNKKD